MALGRDARGEPLFAVHDEAEVADALVKAMEQNVDEARRLSQPTMAGAAFREEVRRRVTDPGDPRAVGWTFLINEDDPRRDEYSEALRPLAEHRGMADPATPLSYRGETADEWFDWLHDEYYALDLAGKQVPHYILLVGDPAMIPFRFQSLLDAVANVGRVDFEEVDDLRTYVEKVIRLESAPVPVVDRTAVFFGPDGGMRDPTFFSRKYMVEPLAEHVREHHGIEVELLVDKDATKDRLTEALTDRKPALVYTASHGLGAIDETANVQKRLNGAICCQRTGLEPFEDLFTADDVPVDVAFHEGAVFFQFACFGYGTPAESDYAHWLGAVPERYTDVDFVAALPKRLLAHPRGPVGYVGHLDTAFLHGFADVEAPHTLERWHTRIAPFKMAVDDLLGVQPSGIALNSMNARYGVCNMLITNTYDQERRGRLEWTPQLKARFLDNWIERGDAQNYMVLGDPAARLRLPS